MSAPARSVPAAAVVVYLANDTLLQGPVVLRLLRRGDLTTERMVGSALSAN
jgi:hypothetical protein